MRLKLTPERQAVIVDAIQRGGNLRIACGVARIGTTTIERWLRRGREELADWEAADGPEDEPPGVYARFVVDVTEALARRDLDWLAELKGSVDDKSWTRIAWLLERHVPGEFALRDQVPRRFEMTDRHGATLRVQGGAELDGVLDVLRRAGVAPPEAERAGDARPALPAAGALLAEPAAGERAASGVPAAPRPRGAVRGGRRRRQD